MGMSDELEKLAELRQRDVLSDDEFARAKARLLDGAPPRPAAGCDTPALSALNALRRSAADRWIGGVCGGIARATGVEAWIWRLLFALLALFGGTGVVLYVLLWVFVPSD